MAQSHDHSKTLRDRTRGLARRFYVRGIRPRIASALHRQRVKLIWDAWGYAGMLRLASVPLHARVRFIMRCLAIDWHLLHAHKPSEITAVCRTLAMRPARADEVMIEAGCWQGGSSAKFSILCKLLRYRLRTYDSFEGVESVAPEDREEGYDFAGEYAATAEVVRANLVRYGELDVCSLHPGWFSETLARDSGGPPVRVAYVDCDSSKGTREALAGIVPNLTDDGRVFSQDFHIGSVRTLLQAEETWTALRRGTPSVRHVVRNLAEIRLGSAD